MKLPITYQRIEGLAVFIAATLVYFSQDFRWIWYLLLLFAFDIFMIGYLINNKVGAHSYNLGHSLVGPSLVTVAYLLTDSKLLLGLACLWFAHIGLDRALGYGLKFTSGFKHTHLGDIGKK